jgi:hypothetical protein
MQYPAYSGSVPNLFYSVNRNEKETASGANHLSRDFGTGEEIGGSGATGAE